MIHQNKFHTLSYQILDLLERDLINSVLKGDTFYIKEKQLKIINNSNEGSQQLTQLLDKCINMGLEVSPSPNSIQISLPDDSTNQSWNIVSKFIKNSSKAKLGDLINQIGITDVLIRDMIKNKQNWTFDADTNLVNSIRKIMISFRTSGSGIVFIRAPSIIANEFSNDYYELSSEESLVLISFVDLNFSFNLSQDESYLKRVENLKKILE